MAPQGMEIAVIAPIDHSMPIEQLHFLLCVTFLLVWAMIGQVAIRERGGRR
jgi:hypothetical protein